MPKKRTKAANGEGSISFEKALGRFRAAFTDPQGKRIVKRFKERQQAVEWLTMARAEMYRGEYVPSSDITIGNWIVEYLNTYVAPKVKSGTLIRYLQTANQLSPIADIQLQQLQAPLVQKFYNALPPMSNSSKVKIHRLLKSAVTKAVRLGMLQKNIMDNVTGFTVKQSEIETFSVEEIHTILDYLSTSSYYKRYYPFVKLAVSTGARLGELLGLKKSCVHYNSIEIKTAIRDANGQLVESTPKTKAGRRKITISEDMAAQLRSISGEEYVFCGRYGAPWRPSLIAKAWKKILENAHVPFRTFHSLRHTHATHLLANDVPLLEVAKRLGHASSTTTLRYYAHAIPGYDAQLPERISRIFDL